MLLAAASLDPAQQVAVPCTYSQTDAALAYWLSNPLLLARYPELVAERTEQLPFLSIGHKQALVLRLKSTLEKLRRNLPLDGAAYNRLLSIIRDELVSRDERVGLKPHLVRLRGAEMEWEYERLEAAIRARAYAMHEHADAA